MKILLVTETLHTGGAETFVVRLANALSRYHEVVVVNIFPHLSKPALMNRFVPEVTAIHLEIPQRRLRQKISSLLSRLGRDYSLLDRKIVAMLGNIIRQHKPDIVHTHLFKPDYYATLLQEQYRYRQVTTLHGDYFLYDKSVPHYMQGYASKRNRIFRQMDAVVVISDDQLKWYHERMQELGIPPVVRKILNGYETGQYTAQTRDKLGIPETAIVFGMVSRGIAEKGWQYLVSAFLAMKSVDTYLLLVGEGEEITRLRNLYASETQIIFAGYAERPVEYISLFDVGMLTSVYRAESLPTVVIEYLYCRKPVIATDIGEIRNMITCPDERVAGELLPCPDFTIDTAALADIMSKYTDRHYLSGKLACTPAAFEKFDMNSCVQQYIALYKQTLINKRLNEIDTICVASPE